MNQGKPIPTKFAGWIRNDNGSNIYTANGLTLMNEDEVNRLLGLSPDKESSV